MMSTASETPVTQRQILLVGPYGVLGTGVIDAVANNPQWEVTTAARRPAPAYRAQSAPPHISVDLMDREGTKNAFSSLREVTDLIFAAYVEKPAMAETVEPNASMLKNALDALAAGSVPVQRVVLAGGAKSYGFSLGSSSDVLLCTDLSKSSAEGPLVSLIRNQEDQ
jgi:nucleoside-diphosphate-sugar epimerase